MRKRAVLGATAVCAVAVGVLAGPVGAQDGTLPIEVSTTSAPAGTVVEVTGSGCQGPVVVELEVDPGVVEVQWRSSASVVP